MPEPKVLPCGSWPSPITAGLIASAMIGLDQIVLDGDDTYWIEGRPTEGGRHVVVRRAPDGRVHDAIPSGWNARTRVHEYGGGAYTVRGGVLWFSHFPDGRLYRQTPGASPQPVTPEGAWRYADLVVDAARDRLLCVREDHTDTGREAVNTIAAVPAAGRPGSRRGPGADPRVLLSGNDFYAAPRVSPDGARLAWLTWNHPNMPWDGTELWAGTFGPDGSIAARERVAGGAAESVIQPEWTPDGTLCFLSDRTGWYNLYRLRGGRVEPLCAREAEFGGPAWQFGLAWYAVESDRRLVCTYRAAGMTGLARLDLETRALEPVETPYTMVWSVHARAGSVVCGVASPVEHPAIARIDGAAGRVEILRRSTEISVDPGYLSPPEAIEFPTEGGLTAYGNYYAPRNRDARAASEERPPLIVNAHGGPTGHSPSALNLGIQYWTSRGFAVLDVNYGGSTGYGRAYRERLNGQWGVVDVDDCLNGARALVARGLADGRRLIIHGGSAGGYTTLAAMTFRDVFAAGASYFGISDLDVFHQETHKFESRYDQHLIGPYPERRDLYRERSPLNFVERLRRPLILFQGLEDKIVPPNQSEMIFDALRRRGVPVAYLAYEGEQHGFRQAAHIKRTLEAELYFYSRVFGFPLAEVIEPVRIENL